MINTIAKIIPLFIIIDNKISNNDIIFTVYFVLLYLIYMQYIKEDIICVYRNYIEFIIDKDKGKESSFYNIYIQLQNNF
jgi:Ca2+/Na+ antiporter